MQLGAVSGLQSLSRARGFSMLEVMVSVIVLSVGFLGLAILQTNGVRFSHDAYLRSLATSHAYQMLDRMRANPQAIAAGNYNFGATLPTTTPNCTTCTPADSATRDGFEWRQTLSNSLPSGTGAITLNGGRYQITVMWDRRNTDAPNPVCGSDPLVNLSCFTIELLQ